MRIKYLEFIKLKLEHVKALSEMLKFEQAQYIQYFHPFSFDEDSIIRTLKSAKFDKYYGIVYGELIGFFMLRGWDQGYKIPSYGVYINSKFSGKGLGTLTLNYAESICHLSNVQQLMLKVHPENIIAKNLYARNGYTYHDIDPRNQHLILRKKLSIK